MREYMQMKTNIEPRPQQARSEDRVQSSQPREDRPVWLQFQPVTGKGMGLEGPDRITPTRNTLDQRIESGREQTMHVPGAIFPLIADLALYAEIWVQCTAFAPTVFHHASAYDKQAEKTASPIAGYSMVAIEREVYALCDKDNEKGLRGGHKVHHSEDVLDYPIDKPRTKARNERMQRAESNLGNFWNEFDKHVKMHCPKAISHCWETQWPQTVELKRTQDWVDAETGPVLSATPFSFGDEKASKTEETSSVSKNRKKKRRNGKVLDSPKTDALLADTPPGAPDSSPRGAAGQNQRRGMARGRRWPFLRTEEQRQRFRDPMVRFS